MGERGGLIFYTSTGKPISPANMVKSFKEETARLGLPKIRFHDLRHTSASLIASKVHPKILQMRMGHSQISTTYDIYAHLFENMQTEASDEIDKVLGVP
jgi:integrase